jgi:hypothetical protein
MSIPLVSLVRTEFEERRQSLLREPGKHDCIVGATMEELNPSELQEGNDCCNGAGLTPSDNVPFDPLFLLTLFQVPRWGLQIVFYIVSS